MDRTSTALKHYLLVSFAVTWLFWIPVTLATYQLPSFAEPYPRSWFEDIVGGGETNISHWLIIIGGILGPFLGALAGWRALAGEKGVRTLFRHLRPSHSDWKGWLGGLIPLGYFGLLTLLFFLLFGVGVEYDRSFLYFLAFLLAGAIMIAGEELGWRGTMQPMLQERRSALWAAVLVGIAWAYWHIPLFLMSFLPPGPPQQGFVQAAVMTLLFPISTIPVAILMAGVFNGARGLILVPILFHALNNELNASLGPSGDAAAIEQASAYAAPAFLVALWLFAVAMWVAFGRTSLSSRPKVTATKMLEGVEKQTGDAVR
jgi:membrane protease YdiL (CAAX protease family)